MGYWSEPTSHEIVSRRAGGRRRYNSERKLAAAERRQQVEALMVCYWNRSDFLASIARVLGVSVSTVSRDLEALGLRDMMRDVRREERVKRHIGPRVRLSRAERARQAEAIAAHLPRLTDLVSDVFRPEELLR